MTPDLSSFFRAPAVYAADGFHSAFPGVKPVFLAGPPWRGRETRVFAWYGVPEHTADEVPGIVLVHGGLGTAYAGWVKSWLDRGFAAIAIDMYGGLPDRTGAYGQRFPRERHAFSCPDAAEKFHDLDLPLADQWPYHAVAGILSAAGFLSSLPGVDADKIGMTGISWGGYAVALAAGYGDRFRFAVPVYGCGGLPEQNTAGVPPEKVAKYLALWDPDRTLARAAMPMLWIGGANDFFYDLADWNRSSSLPRRSWRALRPSMPHDQREGEFPPELEFFVRTVLAGGEYPGFDAVRLDAAANRLEGVWHSSVEIVKAQIARTRARGCWHDSLFRTSPAELDRKEHTVAGDLPEDWAAAYLVLTDAEGRIYTSEVFFREQESVS